MLTLSDLMNMAFPNQSWRFSLAADRYAARWTPSGHWRKHV